MNTALYNLEVAADWHELVVPWRIMWPSIARDSGHPVQHQMYHRRITAVLYAFTLYLARRLLYSLTEGTLLS